MHSKHPNKAQSLSVIEIALTSVNEINVGCGFTFKLFKVNKKGVEVLFKKPINGHDQLIVKVFDPVKAKRDHKNYRAERTDMFNTCRKAYLCEKLAYEILSSSGLLNNV